MDIISCGIIITSPQGWLLAHATRTSRWDIPKGRQEDGETPLQAALRECYEETNLNLNSYEPSIQDLGQHAYIRGKKLHLFRLDLDVPLDLSNCSCHTNVDIQGDQYPETDRWEWVPREHLFERIGKGLGELFIGLNLAAPDDPQWWSKRQTQPKRR